MSNSPLDEKRTQFKKQMQRMCNDPTGLEVIQESLNIKLKKVDGPKGQFAIAVLVPSYRGLHPKMQDSSAKMIRYAQQFPNIEVFTEPVQGSSLISWVRNDMQAKLLKSGKPFSHVLWIDDDMVLQDDYLVRMIERDKDVVGCVYTHRTDPPVRNLHLLDIHKSAGPKILDWKQKGLLLEASGLLSAKEADHTVSTGTGLLLVKKEVIERVGDYYVNCSYESKLWNLSDEQCSFARKKRMELREQTGNAYWFQLLPGLSGWGELGEDASFCLKAALCGYKVYIDTTITPGHMGEYEYSDADFVHFKEQEVRKARARGVYEEESTPACTIATVNMNPEVKINPEAVCQ